MELDAESARKVEAARQRSIATGWLTIEQAAAMLGVSVRTIRRREASGGMPKRIKRGRRLGYQIEDLRSMLNGEA